MFPILLSLFVSRNQQNAVTLENLALVGIWTDGVLIVHIIIIEIIKLTPYISIIIVEIIRQKKQSANQREEEQRHKPLHVTIRLIPPLQMRSHLQDLLSIQDIRIFYTSISRRKPVFSGHIDNWTQGIVNVSSTKTSQNISFTPHTNHIRAKVF